MSSPIDALNTNIQWLRKEVSVLNERANEYLDSAKTLKTKVANYESEIEANVRAIKVLEESGQNNMGSPKEWKLPDECIEITTVLGDSMKVKKKPPEIDDENIHARKDHD